MAEEDESKAAIAAEKAYEAAVSGASPDDKVTSPTAPKTEAAVSEASPDDKATSPAAPKAKADQKAKGSTTAKRSATKPRAKAKARKPKASAPRKTPAGKAPARKKAAATKPAAKASPKQKAPPIRETAAVETTTPTVQQLKEHIMATAKKSPDMKKKVSETLADVTSKAKAAFEKSNVVAGEVGEFTKGNVSALMESGKIFSTGVQQLGREYVEDTKGAFETATDDMKKLAAVKSPTELFQLQGEMMRRNFDAAVAYGSKSSEKIVKLANDTFAPLSSRVSVAVDKISKAA